PPATTGPPMEIVPSWATHLTFFWLPFLMLQSAGRSFSTVLARFRCGVPPNIGQDRPAVGGGSSGFAFSPAAPHHALPTASLPSTTRALAMNVLRNTPFSLLVAACATFKPRGCTPWGKRHGAPGGATPGLGGWAAYLAAMAYTRVGFSVIR